VRLPACLLLLALTLAGCESNIEKSAHLAKLAHHHHTQHGLSIARASTNVEVVEATILRGAESVAAVVRLRNTSAHTLRDVPVAITVKNTAGDTLFQNDAPGLEAALTSLASLPAHSEATWVDDQVQAAGVPTSVSAIAGEASTVSGPIPQIEAGNLHPGEEGSPGDNGTAGTVHNRSDVAQQNLVVYVLARRAGRIIAAGRAVLPEVAAGASVQFQAFLVGTSTGAELEASAPPTTLE
jgi:hypothetical protein